MSSGVVGSLVVGVAAAGPASVRLSRRARADNANIWDAGRARCVSRRCTVSA